MMNLTANEILNAYNYISKQLDPTPLTLTKRFSKEFDCNLYVKREDLQEVRSYKIRGAMYKIQSLSKEEKAKGIVCASAGNHAQGVAFTAHKLGIKATIFMPEITPEQKIARVKFFGDDLIDVRLAGQTYDESCDEAKKFAEENDCVFIHPFDDEKVICGQGTVAVEICNQINVPIDYMICPIGGGGLISGVSTFMKEKMPECKIIGVEPKGAHGMKHSFQKGEVTPLESLSTFVDGAAVRTVGKITYKIASKLVDRIILVEEEEVSQMLIEVYQNEGIILEPAGALSLAALKHLKANLRGKNVVCILSGGNNNLFRYPEIIEKAMSTTSEG